MDRSFPLDGGSDPSFAFLNGGLTPPAGLFSPAGNLGGMVGYGSDPSMNIDLNNFMHQQQQQQQQQQGVFPPGTPGALGANMLMRQSLLTPGAGMATPGMGNFAAQPMLAAPVAAAAPAPAAPATRGRAGVKKEKRSAETSSQDESKSGSSRASKKAKSGPLTEEELKERRKKHNEVEIRRRQRIKNSFTELGSIIGCDSKQKRIILSTAIDAIKDFESKIANLQESIQSLDAPTGDEAKAGAPNDPSAGLNPFSTTPVDHGSIFHTSGVPLHIASFDGRILDCNTAFSKLFGYTREQLIDNQATSFFALTAPESLSVAFSTVGSLMNGQSSVQATFTIIAAEGVHRRVRLTAWSIKENKKPKYFMSMIFPVTDDALPTNAPKPAGAPEEAL